MANVEMNFTRGMSIAFNLMKDGKKHTLKSIRATFAKEKIKKGVIGRMYRLGRLGRSAKTFDIIIELPDGTMSETATFQMAKGAQAKKSFTEKAERYGSLAEARKPKKVTKKKTVAKKSSAKPTKKTVKKAAPKKKAAVHAGGGSSESASDDSVLES